MLRRLLFIFTLALLFGLGQQAVVTHAISHTADWQETQPQPDDKPHTLSACAQCLAYAGLGHAIGSTPPGVIPATYSPPLAGHVASSAGIAARPHYRARAPPAFLA